MKFLTFFLIFCFQISFGQSPLIVEGNTELAEIKLNGEPPWHGYMTFRPSPSVLQGYWGVWYNSAFDVDFGTFKSLSKIHLSTNLDDKLSIYPDGSVYIKSLSGVGTRKVYASMFGQLSAPAEDHRMFIGYSDFRANDADGEHMEVVQSQNGVEFVQHQGDFGDDGVLVAPINLRSNVKLKKMEVSYINRASNNNAGNRYEICIQYGKKIPDNNQVTLDRTTWTNLDKGGAIIPSTSEIFEIKRELIDFPDIVTTSDRIYSILVKCEDCNLQYLRGVMLTYSDN